jgi:hypothetical protein
MYDSLMLSNKNKTKNIKPKMVAQALRVSKKWEKENFEQKNVWQLSPLTWFKKLSNKNQSIKPKISQVAWSNRGKTRVLITIDTKRHLDYLGHFEKSLKTKIDGIFLVCGQNFSVCRLKIDLIDLRHHLGFGILKLNGVL